MRAALSLVWVAPERSGFGSSVVDGAKRSRNGHAAQSTIAVVEDEILVRLAVCDHLRAVGYRVLEASSGEDAQSIFRAGEPVELLFTDIDLGSGMNGLGLATWVRQHYPDVRILLASGVTEIAEDEAHLCDGPLLRKPYSHTVLADYVKQLLDSSGQQTG